MRSVLSGTTLSFSSKPAGDKDLEADEDEYRAAEDACLSCQLRACLPADGETCVADEEGDEADECAGEERLSPVVVRDGEAHRQRVDGGRHALHQQSGEGNSLALTFLILAGDALVEHFSAYVAEQCQSDPGNELLESAEELCDGGNADPADHRHSELEEGEDACDAAHSALSHAGLVESVCQRDREGVHGESDAEQYAREEEVEVECHKNPPKNKKIQARHRTRSLKKGQKLHARQKKPYMSLAI